MRIYPEKTLRALYNGRMHPQNDKLLLTVKDAAARLSMSRRTLERLVSSGDFPPFLKSGGSKVPLTDILDYIETLKRRRAATA